jgi:DNA-binding transcriptional LysR family regulator
VDRLYLMGVFVAVAESESFAAAGRRLGMSPPAVTRAVSALETRLGVRLLTRSTRIVRITEAGARYLEDCRRIIADADEADESVAGSNATPRGNLSVTAPVLFGHLYVMPGIVEYLRRYPDVAVRALFLDRVVNLVEEGLEVAVRIGELPDSSLKALHVGHVRRVLCAAPGYLAARGTPLHPDQLTQHTIISASGVTPLIEWSFQNAGRPFQVRVQPRLVVTTNDGAIAAAAAGLGITRLLSYQLAPQLAAGALEIVLADFELPPLPVHVVHREGRQSSAKVRTFVDLLVARLRADPALAGNIAALTQCNARSSR